MRMLYKSELIFVASSAFAKTHRISASADRISSLPFLSLLEDVRRPTWTLTGRRDIDGRRVERLHRRGEASMLEIAPWEMVSPNRPSSGARRRETCRPRPPRWPHCTRRDPRLIHVAALLPNALPQ
jgi:hypothetical protein